MNPIPFGRGVCYSGYRENQSPITKIYPDDAQVLEDLKLLLPHFDYLRMYDVSEHARTVLRVIEKHKLPLRVMLGVEPRGEISNPNCPWGGLHSETEIAENRRENILQLDRLADLANRHPGTVLAVSVGNENTSDWHPNLMPPETLAEHVRYLKTKVKVPVTFCEGEWFWRAKGAPIAKEADFLSIHCYPLWMKKALAEAVTYTVRSYEETVAAYPGKPVLFTEFGWTTSTNASMDASQVGEPQQAEYLRKMEEWRLRNQVTMFVFEAFDEPWKGGKDPVEPEKHWGLWNVDRTPKSHVLSLVK